MYDVLLYHSLRVMKMINVLKIIIGAIGWVWFMIPVVFSGVFNIGSAIGLMFFGVLFLWGVFGKRLKAKCKEKKWARVLSGLLKTGYIALCVLFAIESILITSAVIKTPSSGDTTLVVLGCAVYGERPSQMLTQRIDAAEKFMKENPEANAVLSGGRGPEEDISEALCMFRELTSRGIDESRLFVEDKSTNTRENIAFSQEIINEKALSKNITIVTNNYHLYRASLSVKAQGTQCCCIPAETTPVMLPTYIMREYMGIIAQLLYNMIVQ